MALGGCGSTKTKTVTVIPPGTTPTAVSTSTATSASTTASTASTATPATSAWLVSRSAGTVGPYVSEPSMLSFSVDGDLSAEHLKWSDWGQPVTFATGTFIFDKPPNHVITTVPGRVTLSRPVSCKGRSYYTVAVVRALGGSFNPSSPTMFSPPCGPS